MAELPALFGGGGPPELSRRDQRHISVSQRELAITRINAQDRIDVIWDVADHAAGRAVIAAAQAKAYINAVPESQALVVPILQAASTATSMIMFDLAQRLS